jgi:DNA processing protein
VSSPPEGRVRACEACLARSWLLQRLSGSLDRVGGEIEAVLALPDDELIAAVAGRRRVQVEGELNRLDLAQVRARSRAAGIETICRCDENYPVRLRSLDAPPAVLHVLGGLEPTLDLLAADAVAIVGARRASTYGLEVARSLGRGLAAAGVTVVSGMALGVDSAAHAGALAARRATVAVLPAGADRPYPASRRTLHRSIAAAGAVVSELPAGGSVRRWTPLARNRIIAALATMTVVVEATERSGALLTAARAGQLGRRLGAVPGRVTSPLAAGPNGLIRAGAALIEGVQDVLDELFGEGVVGAVERARPALSDELERLRGAIADGQDTAATLARAGFATDQILAGLSALELSGYVRREAGGRFVAVP